MKKIFFIISVLTTLIFANMNLENGLNLYKSGRYEEALLEFDKILMKNENNHRARR